MSSDGSTVIFQSLEGAEFPPGFAVIKHLDTGATTTLDLEDAVVHDITADGKLAMIDHEGKLKLWDVAAGEVVGDFAPDPITHQGYAQFALDGRRVVSTGGDAQVHVWDLDSGNEVLRYPGPTSARRRAPVAWCSSRCPSRPARS